MAFFDKVQEYAEKAVDKGSDIVETQKLKSKISGIQKEISKSKIDIAEIIMKKVEAGEFQDEEIQGIIAGITDKLAEITDLEKMIEDLKKD